MHYVRLRVFGSNGQQAVTNSTVYVRPQSSSAATPAAASAEGGKEPGRVWPQAARPTAFALEATYPNPFHEATQVAYALPERAEVRLAAYDLLGREVAVLVDEAQGAGRHRARLEAAGLASGVYVVRFTAEGAAKSHAETQRVVLVK